MVKEKDKELQHCSFGTFCRRRISILVLRNQLEDAERGDHFLRVAGDD